MKPAQPVRLGLTFDESMLTTTKHAAVLTLTTGVDEAGRLTARRAEIVLDGGAYADASVTVAIKAGFRIGGPYRWTGDRQPDACRADDLRAGRIVPRLRRNPGVVGLRTADRHDRPPAWHRSFRVQDAEFLGR